MFYDHPAFLDVRLEVRGPVYGGTKYVRIKGVWWLKRGIDGMELPWLREDMTVLRVSWERFVEGCRS